MSQRSFHMSANSEFSLNVINNYIHILEDGNLENETQDEIGDFVAQKLIVEALAQSIVEDVINKACRIVTTDGHIEVDSVVLDDNVIRGFEEYPEDGDNMLVIDQLEHICARPPTPVCLEPTIRHRPVGVNIDSTVGMCNSGPSQFSTAQRTKKENDQDSFDEQCKRPDEERNKTQILYENHDEDLEKEPGRDTTNENKQTEDGQGEILPSLEFCSDLGIQTKVVSCGSNLVDPYVHVGHGHCKINSWIDSQDKTHLHDKMLTTGKSDASDPHRGPGYERHNKIPCTSTIESRGKDEMTVSHSNSKDFQNQQCDDNRNETVRSTNYERELTTQDSTKDGQIEEVHSSKTPSDKYKSQNDVCLTASSDEMDVHGGRAAVVNSSDLSSQIGDEQNKTLGSRSCGVEDLARTMSTSDLLSSVDARERSVHEGLTGTSCSTKFCSEVSLLDDARELNSPEPCKEQIQDDQNYSLRNSIREKALIVWQPCLQDPSKLNVENSQNYVNLLEALANKDFQDKLVHVSMSNVVNLSTEQGESSGNDLHSTASSNVRLEPEVTTTGGQLNVMDRSLLKGQDVQSEVASLTEISSEEALECEIKPVISIDSEMFKPDVQDSQSKSEYSIQSSNNFDVYRNGAAICFSNSGNLPVLRFNDGQNAVSTMDSQSEIELQINVVPKSFSTSADERDRRADRQTEVSSLSECPVIVVTQSRSDPGVDPLNEHGVETLRNVTELARMYGETMDRLLEHEEQLMSAELSELMTGIDQVSDVLQASVLQAQLPREDLLLQVVPIVRCGAFLEDDLRRGLQELSRMLETIRSERGQAPSLFVASIGDRPEVDARRRSLAGSRSSMRVTGEHLAQLIAEMEESAKKGNVSTGHKEMTKTFDRDVAGETCGPEDVREELDVTVESVDSTPGDCTNCSVEQTEMVQNPDSDTREVKDHFHGKSNPSNEYQDSYSGDSTDDCRIGQTEQTLRHRDSDTQDINDHFRGESNPSHESLDPNSGDFTNDCRVGQTEQTPRPTNSDRWDINNNFRGESNPSNESLDPNSGDSTANCHVGQTEQTPRHKNSDTWDINDHFRGELNPSHESLLRMYGCEINILGAENQADDFTEEAMAMVEKIVEDAVSTARDFSDDYRQEAASLLSDIVDDAVSRCALRASKKRELETCPRREDDPPDQDILVAGGVGDVPTTGGPEGLASSSSAAAPLAVEARNRSNRTSTRKKVGLSRRVRNILVSVFSHSKSHKKSTSK